MRGLLPSHRPVFPSTFLEEAEQIVRRRTIPYHLRQRAALVLLLAQQPLVSNIEAAPQVQRLCRKSPKTGKLSRANY